MNLKVEKWDSHKGSSFYLWWAVSIYSIKKKEKKSNYLDILTKQVVPPNSETLHFLYHSLPFIFHDKCIHKGTLGHPPPCFYSLRPQLQSDSVASHSTSVDCKSSLLGCIATATQSHLQKVSPKSYFFPHFFWL